MFIGLCGLISLNTCSTNNSIKIALIDFLVILLKKKSYTGLKMRYFFILHLAWQANDLNIML